MTGEERTSLLRRCDQWIRSQRDPASESQLAEWLSKEGDASPDFAREFAAYYMQYFDVRTFVAGIKDFEQYMLTLTALMDEAMRRHNKAAVFDRNVPARRKALLRMRACIDLADVEPEDFPESKPTPSKLHLV